MAWLGSAWWPGGRTTANPFCTSPLATLSASSITDPTAYISKKTDAVYNMFPRHKPFRLNGFLKTDIALKANNG